MSSKDNADTEQLSATMMCFKQGEIVMKALLVSGMMVLRGH